MVMEYVPAVALLPTVSFRVEVPDPGAAVLDGLKFALTPDGSPPAESETAELNPSKTRVVTVIALELPAFTISEGELGWIEKLPLLPDQGVPPVKSLANVP